MADGRMLWESPKLRKLAPEVLDIVQRLVARGRTDSQIADHLKVSRTTAKKLREAAGLQRNVKERSQRFQICLPAALLADLRRAAEAEGHALSEEIRRRCAAPR